MPWVLIFLELFDWLHKDSCIYVILVTAIYQVDFTITSQSKKIISLMISERKMYMAQPGHIDHIKQVNAAVVYKTNWPEGPISQNWFGPTKQSELAPASITPK